MNTLAYGPGPGPWILLMPLIWCAVVVGVVALVRHTGMWRTADGRRGYDGRPLRPGRIGHSGREESGENSPIALLGRRFAAGEIDEDEYWRRLSVLDEQFGRPLRGDDD
ncbi:SHOCT domain-containing protein [Streptomyces sp. NPDC056500]|uniref:SHOCT domain-containing protein n=1 Tax=Streptomyces sp. NPDC056500 TaxID=3345840 RepID=UPI0036BD1747